MTVRCGSSERVSCVINSDGDRVHVGVTVDAEALDIRDNHPADSEENVASRLDTTAAACD